MTSTSDLAVCIGRFQLFHNGHAALIRRALDIAPRCAVVLGSAHQARTPRNPFTWEERAEMIRLWLPPADRSRVDFLPVRDCYDQARWVAGVREAVAMLAQRIGRTQAPAQEQAKGLPTRIALVGHRKDATGDYLRDFPGWSWVDVGPQGAVHAKALRAALFASDDHAAALAAMVNDVPTTTPAFLRSWLQLPHIGRLSLEWRMLEAERLRWAGSPYAPMFVTVDAVVRKAGHVLLIRRGRAPGQGLLAVPGGFLEPRETVYQSALRELEEETGLKLLDSTRQAALRGVRVFDHPDRSQRGRVITHAHYFDLGDGPLPEVRGSDDASEAMWVRMKDIAAMEDQFHDDHFNILQAVAG